MKRNISILCVAVMLIATILSVFATTTVAADYTDFTMALEASEINADGTFIVDVVLYNNPGVAGYEFWVSFDKTKVQIVDVIRDEDDVPKSVFPAETTLNIDEEGVVPSECSEIRAVAARAQKSVKNGVILSIEFKLCEGVRSADLYLENVLFAKEDKSKIYPDLVNTTASLPPFTVSLEAGEIRDDDTFIVDVVVSNNPGVSGYQYDIDFDNTKIQIVDVVRDEDDVPESKFPAEATLNIDEGSAAPETYSELRANAARAKEYAKDGVFLSVIFKFCEGVYSADLSFSDVMFVDSEEKEQTVKTVGLSVSRPQPDFMGQCGDDVKYELFRDTGLLKIKGNGDMWDFAYAGAPWYENRYDIKTVKVIDGVTSIGDRAFSMCVNLTDIAISDSVKRIGAFAFADSSLLNVEISKNVATIGENAFQACYRLTGMTVDAANANYCDVDGVLFSKDAKTLVAYPGGGRPTYTIPSGVTAIGDYAFIKCTNITSVTIPNSVTRIGKSAFSGCENLSGIVLPSGVTVIDNSVFSFCGSLTSIVIPENVTKIGEFAFESCSGLTSIVIPEKVESIEALAFQYCSGLETVTFKSRNATIGSMAFHGCENLETIYCYRDSTADDYFNAEYTKKYMDIRTVTYNLNGGVGTFAPQEDMECEAIVLYSTIPTKTGYNFIGWLGSDGKTYNAGDVYSENAALTLTAVWEIKTYSITYDANGGENAPANATKEHFANYTVSSVVPTKTGYNFLGWLGSDGKDYAAGDVYSGNTDLILTAKWIVSTYTVTYDANGGNGAPAEQTKNLDVDLVLSDVIPTRKGYKFLGWATSTDGKAVYAPGATYSKNANVVLYAAWEKIAYGDPNGDGSINTKDAVLLAQYLAGWSVRVDLSAADCNGDGSINTKDAVLLAQYLAGWSVTLG